MHNPNLNMIKNNTSNRGMRKKKSKARNDTSINPPWTTSTEIKVRVWSSLTKTSHLLKSIQNLLKWKKIRKTCGNKNNVPFSQVKNRRNKTDWRWIWSFCFSIETTESIWCTRIGTVLPKLIWNSLPKATCSSFSSFWQRTFKGTSTSTALRFGSRDETFLKKADSSFFDGDEMLTVQKNCTLYNLSWKTFEQIYWHGEVY